MKSHVFHELLAKSPLFHGLEGVDRADVYDMFEHAFAVSGEYLVRQGDPADCMYLVLSGRLQVLAEDDDGVERLVTEATRGETVGEMSMITGAVRSATVRAARDTELARLSKEHFDVLVRDYPGALMHITRILVRRIDSGLRPAGDDVFSTLTVVPAGDDAPVSAFLDVFLPTLAREGSVLHLDRRAFDAALGEGAAEDDVDVWDHTDARIADWLTDQELAHRFIVFQADHGDTAWTRRCLRQADRALLVGQAGKPAKLSPAERILFDTEGFAFQTPADLVLVHERVDTPPTGTAAWLSERPVVRHHHVHLGTPSHVERVIRFLTNRAVGVVLGGGGAKGSAHFGVLRALHEAGIPVDMIGGTSSGAGVSAQYARGESFAEMRDNNHRLFVRHNPFAKVTLPMVSFVAQKSVDDVSRAMCGDRQIEDLWIPFFAVSCNLSTGATVVHRSGPLWKAVRATTALPGVFTPMVDDRHLLVDGGIVDNVPVAIMKELNPGPAIVVNISPDVDLVLPDDQERFPSPWKMLRKWLNPFAATLRIPTIVSILGRVVLINSVARKKQTMAMADFFLEPPVAGFGMLESAALDDIIAIGYQYAKGEIAGWLQDPALAAKLPLARTRADA